MKPQNYHFFLHMKLLIVQTSPQHTASTLLVNSLYGMICELSDHRCVFASKGLKDGFENEFKDVILVKSHTPISAFRTKYAKQYKLLFICSQRQEINKLVNDTGSDVVVFNYEELNETHSTRCHSFRDQHG